MWKNGWVCLECSYKEVDGQLKEQFIHGLNESERLTKITREVTKSPENIILNEHVLTWVKRVEARRAQAAVRKSLHELKNFNAFLQMDKAKQHREKTNHTCTEDANTAVRTTN